MSKLGGLLARKSPKSMPKSAPKASAESPLAAEPAAKTEAPVAEPALDLDEELFSAQGAQLGGGNETLRNLLLNAHHKVGELDAIKDAVAGLVEPMNKALRDFEVEKNDKLNLQAVLGNTRAAYAKLRNEWNEWEKKAALSERDCVQLRQELAASQNAARLLEGTRAELAIDIAARRAQITDLETRLKHETADAKAAREENHRLADRQNAADKRLVALDSELHTLRQQLAMSGDENGALQASFNKASAEASRLGRKLAEAESNLGALQTRLRLVEANLGQVTSERSRLASTLEEMKERHEAELSTQQMRFEAMQARAIATDRLLSEARDQLTARAEEIRSYDRNVSVISHERDALAGRVATLESELLHSQSELNEVEQDKSTLIERAGALATAYNGKEAALARSEETIAALKSRIADLDQALEASRSGAEQKLEELEAALRRERLERAVVQGALEAGRKDFSKLMSEVMAMQRRQADAEPSPAPSAANAA
jgi:crescentin